MSHAILAATLRLLFIPVSAPRGTGEYARALAVASEAQRRRPEAQIHFVVSGQAPYAHHVPYPTTVLASSPTFHPLEVAQVMRDFRPDLVVFDNAGRTSQLRTARRIGARIVFVSSRERQRGRAFRMRWMRLIDEHWIALPELIAGPLTLFERLKLRLLGRPRVRYLDTLLPAGSAEAAASALSRHGVRDGEYVLVVPGGGFGHKRMREAPQVIARAACGIARNGHATLLVGIQPEESAGERRPDALRLAPPLPMPELIALIRHAKLVVVNGADTLLQVIACARPCVAVPMAPDQVRRLAKLDEAGLHVAVPLETAAIERRVLQLLADEQARTTLVAEAATLRIVDGMDTVQDAIAALVVRQGQA